MNSNHNLLILTLTGTVFSVSYVNLNDIVKSALPAALGTTVSLIVSLFLGILLKKIREIAFCDKNYDNSIGVTKSVTRIKVRQTLSQKV